MSELVWECIHSYSTCSKHWWEGRMEVRRGSNKSFEPWHLFSSCSWFERIDRVIVRKKHTVFCLIGNHLFVEISNLLELCLRYTFSVTKSVTSHMWGPYSFDFIRIYNVKVLFGGITYASSKMIVYLEPEGHNNSYMLTKGFWACNDLLALDRYYNQC